VLVAHVVGARPNFMKAAPVHAALGARPGLDQVVVHTGQHYDAEMSEVFFRQLGLPEPEVNLEVGSASHAVQTAHVMIRLEEVLASRRPDLVLVYGDVNSTVAAALVCAKMGVALGHVEAGLRSFDRAMPEEINRLVTDQLSDLLFTHSAEADQNLAREGVDMEKIFLVGNVMIDTLVRLLPTAQARWPKLLPTLPASEAELQAGHYALATLHRPENVDHPARLAELVRALAGIAAELPVIFPVHPRTRSRLEMLARREEQPGLVLAPPLSYLDFLALQQRAALVITDSGGVQEETTFLGVPCLTLRKNTERPVTVNLGTNRLLDGELERLGREVEAILAGHGKKGRIPSLWDGRAGERIAGVVARRLLGPAAV
jgi:UDP-N-acetylglucosamine 2-epimerase (non-hydrolysing)